jgi:hypothetical protein
MLESPFRHVPGGTRAQSMAGLPPGAGEFPASRHERDGNNDGKLGWVEDPHVRAIRDSGRAAVMLLDE